jgi:hypothetical protein
MLGTDPRCQRRINGANAALIEALARCERSHAAGGSVRSVPN